MISSVFWRTLRTLSIFEEPASVLSLAAAIGRSRQLLDRFMLWTRSWVLGIVWRAVPTGRRDWLGVLRTASLAGTVIVMSVREMSKEL